MKKEKKHQHEKIERITNIAKNIVKTSNFNDNVIADPNGSYTGVPIDRKEKPIQDVDDL